jgi:transglutaminase-like putative cysteine protease
MCGKKPMTAGICKRPLWVLLMTAASTLFEAATAATLPDQLKAFSLQPAALLEAAVTPAARERFPTVMLRSATSLDIDEQQRFTLTTHEIYRIDSAMAVVSSGQVHAAWDPSRQLRPVIRARVIASDGRQHDLDPETLTEGELPGSDPTVFRDLRLVRGPLPAVAVGSVVEVETTVVDLEPAFKAGRLFTMHFGAGQAIETAIVRVTAPSSMPLRYSTQLLPNARVTTRERSGRREVEFLLAPLSLDPLRALLAATGDAPFLPQLLVSTGETWRDVATAYHEVSATFIRPEEVRSLLPATLPANRDERIAALLAVLHERVRYTGVLFGSGKIIPNAPGVILERRYGDCKDKAVVLASLMKAAGIPARLALVNARPGVDLDPGLPGIEAFDHMIVHVAGDQPLWIDPTAEYMKAGEIPWEVRGRWSLVIEDTDGTLARTPDARPVDNHSVEEQIMQMAEFGPGRTTVRVRSNGTTAAHLRLTRAVLPDAATSGLAATFKANYGVADVDDLRVRDDADSPYFEYSFKASGLSGTATNFDEARVQLTVSSMFQRFPYGLLSDGRMADALDGVSDDSGEMPAGANDWVFEPFLSEWQVRIVPPSGFSLRSVPVARELPIGPARFRQHCEADDTGALVCALRLDSGSGRYTVAEAADFRQQFLKLKPTLELAAQFEHEASRLMASGDEIGALRRHRVLAAAEPENTFHLMREAWHLLQLTLIEDARRTAARAVELEPGNARAHAVLGSILEYGDLAAYMTSGFDREGAIRAHREATRLDAGERIFKVRLAEVAAVGRDGFVNSDGSDMGLAISLYEEIIRKWPEQTADRERLIELLWQAGRFEEISPVSADLAADSGSAHLRFAARVVTNGADAAIREDIGRGGLAAHPARAEKALSAIWRRRLYDAARELDAALGGEERAGGKARWLNVMRQSLSATRRPAPPDTAVGAADSVLRMLFRSDDLSAQLSPFFSRKAHVHGSADLVLRSVKNVRTQLTGDMRYMYGPDPEFIRDTAMDHIELEESRLSELASRVDVAIFDVVRTSLFLVREKNGWRLLAAEPYLQAVGMEALGLLDVGDIDAARKWLEGVRNVAERLDDETSMIGRYFNRALPRSEEQVDEAVLRLAAHVLLAGPDASTAGVEQVRRASLVATTEEQRQLWSRLLFRAASADNDTALVLLTVEQMLATEPASSDAMWFATSGYGVAGRWEDSERVAREWVAKEPDVRRPQLQLRRALIAQGKLMEALKLAAEAARSPRAERRDYSSYAWLAVLANAVDDNVVKVAERVETVGPDLNELWNTTLACVYAAAGRVADARRIMFANIDEIPEGELDIGVYWLIRGLIAEHLQFDGIAITAYERVPEDARFSPGSTYELARTRLARLRTQPHAN